MGEFVAEDTAPRGGAQADAEPPRRGGSATAILREAVIVIALSLLIATLVRIFLVQAFLIPSSSMQDTLQVGDRVLVSKLSTRFGDVERGDVVVFEDPNGWLSAPGDESTGPGAWLRNALQFVGVLPDDSEGHLIKRVIAVGGDTVVCCDDDGRVTVNGVAIDESAYLRPGDDPSVQEFDVEVGDGELFVMGDHRSNSGDSRVHGTVPEDRVVGEAFVVAWPISRWSGIPDGGAFDQIPDE
jgi:signal peptidase I